MQKVQIFLHFLIYFFCILLRSDRIRCISYKRWLISRDLRKVVMFSSFQHCPPLQHGMTCSRGERNSYRAFRILSTKQGDNMVRKMSVEQAFVTVNKWIPIRKSTPQPPSFVVIDNPNYPYSGILQDSLYHPVVTVVRVRDLI